MKNIAYIDGQNLHLATTKHPDSPWKVDLARFRIYLERKYNVDRAYYYLGYVSDELDDMYEEIQAAGFILRFREHNPAMKSIKKGNVDTEIVFDVMRSLYKKDDFEKVLLVSGDGDYYRMVSFLIDEDRLKKLLFPDRKRASSLYRNIDNKYHDDLSNKVLSHKIKMKRAP